MNSPARLSSIDISGNCTYNTPRNGLPSAAVHFGKQAAGRPEVNAVERSWFRTHLNQFLFGLYVFLIWASYIYTHYYDWALPAGGMIALALAGIMLALVIVCVPILFRMVGALSVHPGRRTTLLRRLLVFAAAFAAAYVAARLWRYTWGYFVDPEGIYSPDSLEQLEQAVGGKYSDWHPVWHTLLFFKLPLLLTGEKTSIIVFQSIFFCLSIACMTETAYELGGWRSAVLCFSFVMLNPYTGFLLLHPWKDAAFASTSLLAVCLAVRLWCAGSERSVSRPTLVLMGLLLANATLFRHNGILLTLVLLLALLFILGRKRWFLVAAVFVLFIVLIKGPVYHALDVEKPGNRVVETTGLPMTVIGNVVTKNPGAMDGELRDFAYSILTPEEWNKHYQTGNFNYAKWNSSHLQVIEDAGAATVLRYMFKCFRLAPRESLQGLLALTELVYAPAGPIVDELPLMEEYLDKVEPFGVGFTAVSEKLYLDTFLNYCRYIGVSILLVLLPMLVKCDLWSGRDWQRILIALSLLCYDFGTMLLLTGPDYRFFYVSLLCSPILAVLMLYENNDEKEKLSA